MKAQAAPTFPRAQPEPLESWPWLQERASGRPEDGDFPPFKHQAYRLHQLSTWAAPRHHAALPHPMQAWPLLHQQIASMPERTAARFQTPSRQLGGEPEAVLEAVLPPAGRAGA